MIKKDSNYQDVLKTMAIFAMFIDHLGLYLFPEINEFRVVGRFAMPIFGFFAGYNFRNYINISILFAGSLLFAISYIFIYGTFIEMNILISIFLGQIYLYAFKGYLKNFTNGYIHFVILGCLWPLTHKFFDYGSLVMAIMVMGYMVKQKNVSNNVAALVLAFCSFLHTYIVFYTFHNSDFILSLIVVFVLYLLISYSNFERNIRVNLNVISRHTMLIYCVHLIIIEFIWKYSIFH